jgi:hypothetical protein
MRRADAAVEAVRRNDQVRVERGVGGDVGFELQPDTQFEATRLQNAQQALPADAAKAVAGRADGVALEVDFDVVPMVERIEDLRRGFRVGAFERRQRLIRKYHAPPEGIAGAVPLEYGNLPCRIGFLQQQRGIQAARPAADAGHAHCPITLELDILDVK